MRWWQELAAIQISSDPNDTVIHVVDRYQVRDYLQRPSHQYRPFLSVYTQHNRVETYCGSKINLTILDNQSERQETDVNCHECVAQVEKRQAYWQQFWRSPEGYEIFKMLSGYSKIEREIEESHRHAEALIRSMTEFNDLCASCLKHREPVFTLELPDEILLKLLDYGSVGEVLLAFKLDKETRQGLKTELGDSGFALLGSRLISKGYISANDPIFRNW